MHQIRFWMGLRPRPAGGAHSARQTPSWILEVILLRGGRGEKGEERGTARGRERRGRRGKGKGGRPSAFAPPPPEKFPSYATVFLSLKTTECTVANLLLILWCQYQPCCLLLRWWSKWQPVRSVRPTRPPRQTLQWFCYCCALWDIL